jgi:HK97 family phage portal protein
MRWPWSRKTQPENLVSISDPAFAGYFGLGTPNYSGVNVGESGAVTLSAIWRALSLLSGSLGLLPLRTYQDQANGQRKLLTSVFDDPGGPDGMTPFEWKRTVVVHLKLHGNVFLFKLRNQAGALVGLVPFHPLTVVMADPTPQEVRDGTGPRGGLWFDITLADGEKVHWDANDILHIPGMSLDGKRGLSLVDVARNSLGTGIAGDRSAAKIFADGALISGLVTPEDELEVDEAKQVRTELDRNVAGYENAGKIAVVNRRLKFQPWTMTAVDAQFLQSRQFSIEEVARWTGVPPHLLMQTEKQTSWGTGVEEQNRALGRTVLGPDAALIEQRCSRELKPSTRFVEFDFAGLERPSPEKEIELLIAQVQAGLLTVNEARAIRNLPPLAAQEAPVEPL